MTEPLFSSNYLTPYTEFLQNLKAAERNFPAQNNPDFINQAMYAFHNLDNSRFSVDTQNQFWRKNGSYFSFAVQKIINFLIEKNFFSLIALRKYTTFKNSYCNSSRPHRQFRFTTSLENFSKKPLYLGVHLACNFAHTVAFRYARRLMENPFFKREKCKNNCDGVNSCGYLHVGEPSPPEEFALNADNSRRKNFQSTSSSTLPSLPASSKRRSSDNGWKDNSSDLQVSITGLLLEEINSHVWGTGLLSSPASQSLALTSAEKKESYLETVHKPKNLVCYSACI